MEESECEEHELNLINEEWVSPEEIIVTLECSLCNTKFKGNIKEVY